MQAFPESSLRFMGCAGAHKLNQVPPSGTPCTSSAGSSRLVPAPVAQWTEHLTSDQRVGVCVGVLVGVAVDVIVGVFVGLLVGVLVGVAVGVMVGVLVGVCVGVLVGVAVDVIVGVFVGVLVGVAVGVIFVFLEIKL